MSQQQQQQQDENEKQQIIQKRKSYYIKYKYPCSDCDSYLNTGEDFDKKDIKLIKYFHCDYHETWKNGSHLSMIEVNHLNKSLKLNDEYNNYNDDLNGDDDSYGSSDPDSDYSSLLDDHLEDLSLVLYDDTYHVYIVSFGIGYSRTRLLKTFETQEIAEKYSIIQFALYCGKNTSIYINNHHTDILLSFDDEKKEYKSDIKEIDVSHIEDYHYIVIIDYDSIVVHPFKPHNMGDDWNQINMELGYKK